jgi:predicted PhzF superfamily epimerase YddE/YHI9
VDLCGHATLSAAHAIYETKRVGALQRIEFHTKIGILTAQGKADGTIEMDFPATLPTPSEGAVLEERRRLVKAAFGIGGSDVFYIGSSIYDVLVEVSRPAFKALKTHSIDFSAVAAMGGRGVLITCLGGKRGPPESESAESALMNDTRFDFLSRCFFPLYGIDEDPVTGSAHCALTPYWTSKLPAERQTLTALQASARGGVLSVSMQGDRVLLAGPSVTTMKTKVLV